MKAAALFISTGEVQLPLAKVAEKVFDLLGISYCEERFSAHYLPDEHYFAGYAQNVQVTVYDNDYDGVSEYPFCIHIDRASWRKGTDTIVTDVPTIARMLAAGGLRVFVPKGAWIEADWDGEGDSYEP